MKFVDRLLGALDRFIPVRYGGKSSIERENIPQAPLDELDQKLQRLIEEDPQA